MKKSRFFKSVFARYSVALISIILVSFIVLIVFINLVLNQYYVEQQKKELTRLASSGSNLILLDYHWVRDYGDGESWLEDDVNKDWLWQSIGALYNETDMFIMVADDSGKILYAYDTKMVGQTLAKEVWLSDGNTQENGSSNLGLFDNEQYYFVEAVSDSDSGEVIAMVYAYLPMALVRAPATMIMRIIVFICLVIMLAALLFAYFISHRISQPLSQMSKAAKAFADGDFSVRVPENKGGSEIAEFARVFNDMADSLENTDRTRNDFIANVSHDLRSPMTSINGFIDGMLTGVIPPEKHEHYMRVVLSETRRLSRLVATLLDISKIQAGERKFRMISFDICEMARQIVISFESRIEDKNLDMHFVSDADRMYVMADMDAIYQVLYNLFDNATKFACDEGKVLLSIKEQGGAITVSVYNEGKGIAEEELKLVFDRFYKADRSRGMDKQGTGLGLYISQKIIEAHKKKITAQSVYGESCTFSFSLDKSEKPVRNRNNSV